jgi:hypothetical protein
MIQAPLGAASRVELLFARVMPLLMELENIWKAALSTNMALLTELARGTARGGLGARFQIVPACGKQ